MNTPGKSPTEHRVDLLDVHVVDVLAQVEVLLRHIREVQKGALRVRGVSGTMLPQERQHAAATIRRRVGEMLNESRALTDALVGLIDVAEELERHIESESGVP
jgi:hypothetical protein